MIGRVSEIGTGVTEWRVEERAGTTWLASVCGACSPCAQIRHVALDVVEASRIALEFVAEVGVSDGDERGGALADAAAEQLDHVVLGDHGADVRAAGDHAGALREHRGVRETFPPAAVDGRAMIARPSGARAAPRMKSICPPTPE